MSKPSPKKAKSDGSSAKRGLPARIAHGLFNILISLKTAVVIIVLLTASLATATILESLYDTPTAKYWVYDSLTFKLILFLLGATIFSVAVSRWPWKKAHGPFIMAHVGILSVLIGSWVTQRFGLDANLRIEEGQVSDRAEISSPELVITDGKTLKTVPIEWTPPNAKFSPVKVDEYGIKVTEFISYADPVVSFIPSGEGSIRDLPAVQIRITGGPMRVSQEYWLWLGDPAYANVAAGPAFFFVRTDAQTANILDLNRDELKGHPRLLLRVKSNGGIAFESRSSDNELKKGEFKPEVAKGSVIEPGWKGGVKVTIVDVIPRAINKVTYAPSRLQYKPQSPPSAVHVVAGGGGPNAEIWLGMGDRALLKNDGREIGIAYANRQAHIPFSVKLERFSIDHYAGTNDPSSYSSRVSVVDGTDSITDREISMNEPLHHKGITLYQASYENAEPRPTVSIFSVNKDPGRNLKYYGSLLIVFGSIWLFASRYRKRKGPTTPAAA